MNEQELADLGRRVYETRLRQAMSKEELAREAGVSSITLKRVEDGLPVRETSLVKILNRLGLPLPGDEDAPTHTPGLAEARAVIERLDIAEDEKRAILALLERPAGGDGDDGDAAPMTDVG